MNAITNKANLDAATIERKIRDRLPSTGWNDGHKAIPLLDAVKAASPVEFADWLVNGGTVAWFGLARPHEDTEIYAERPKYGNPADPLPFDNDMYAIDSVRHLIICESQGIEHC